MGILIKIRDFLLRPRKWDVDGNPRKEKPPGEKMFVQVGATKVVFPRLRVRFPRRVEIEDGAFDLMEANRKIHGIRMGESVQLQLCKLNEGETATLEQAKGYMHGRGCSFANIDEFIDFISRHTPGDMLDGPIVALDIDAADEYGNHQGIAYSTDSVTKEERVYLVFGERVRQDWLVLIALKRRNTSKKITP